MPRVLLIPTLDPLPQAEDIVTRLRAAFFGSAEVILSADPVRLDEADAVVILLPQSGLAALDANPAAVGALALPERLVLVALLDGAQLPAATALPPRLGALAYLNRVEIPTPESPTYAAEVGGLIARIAAHFRHAGADEARPAGSPPAAPKSVPWNIIIVGLALMAGLLLLVLAQFNPRPPAANTTAAPGSIAPEGVVVIGLGANFSQALEQGEAMLRGAELALRDRPTITVDGRVYTVNLLAQDAGCSAFAGLQAAEVFTADPDVVAVIGHQCNTSCAAAVGVYDRAGYTTISPACDDPALTDSGAASFNRVVPPASTVAVGAAQVAHQTLGLRRVAVIYDELLLGTQLAADFYGAFARLEGSTITAYRGILSATTDYDALVEQVLADAPEGVYVAGRPSTAAALRMRLPETLSFMYGGGTLSPADVTEFTALAGDTAAGVLVFTAQPAFTADYDALAAVYSQVYGNAPAAPVFAYAYDAMQVLLDSLEATARVDPNGGLRLDRARLAEAVRAYTGTGAAGVLACDGRGECASAPVQMEVIGGR